MYTFAGRRAYVLGADVSILFVSGLLAFALRENFEPSYVKFVAGWVYHASIILAALCVIPLTGIDRGIWRFSSLPDYIRTTATCILVIAVGSMLTVLSTRFDGVARSIPFIHILAGSFLMIAARVAFRHRHEGRRRKRKQKMPLTSLTTTSRTSVLIVGLSRLTETYLQSVEELAADQIQVVGLLGTKERHVGRLASACPILGLAEDVETIVRDLEPHGTIIERIVVTCAFEDLPRQAQSALLSLEAGSSCELQLMAEQLRFVEGPKNRLRGANTSMDQDCSKLRLSFPVPMYEKIARKRFWSIKRSIDFCAALGLLVMLSPVMLVTSCLVAITTGLPVVFWQQRPGLAGVPFRLYKFRTMRSAHDSYGQPLRDEDRINFFGNFLRRTRLDELPQLLNILAGDMSFIGPRPLLPRDQAPSDVARLLVRPGLTGWAQVIGGRTVSADEKAALDVWYIKNASMRLDAAIALRTVPIILFGETVRYAQIESALQELHADGIF